MKRVGLAIIVSALAVPVAAQWVNYPTPGTPRTADGKPNLAAPVQRTRDGKVDFNGVWQRISPTYRRNIAADLKPEEIQPWARELVQQRMEDLGKGHMSVRCLPWGPSYATSERLFKIIQTPGVILMLDEGLVYRQIFMDGRPLESEPNPSWMGYSVGHWDADTLVVDSAGFNDETWLDAVGHPHTEALRMTERYRRRDVGHMDVEVTFTDPAVYARPIKVALKAELEPDTELIEAVCNEGAEKSLEHWTGKASDEKSSEVTVAPDVLASYAGTYVEQDLWGPGPHPRTIQVTLSGGALFAELSNRGKVQLSPQTQTRFAGFFGWSITFLPDSRGATKDLLEMHISGNYKYSKKP
jgi:hypothetical protein